MDKITFIVPIHKYNKNVKEYLTKAINSVKSFIRKQGKRFTDVYTEKQQIKITKCRLVLHIQVYAILVSSY